MICRVLPPYFTGSSEREGFTAFCGGDVEPAYQGSEKRWVKQDQMKARKHKSSVTNRTIVSAEITRTKEISGKKEYFLQDGQEQEDDHKAGIVGLAFRLLTHGLRTALGDQGCFRES